MNEIISIILEEADISIDKAYKEGYKQATVELKPELEYYKTLYTEQKKKSFKDIFIYAGISFGIGFLTGNFLEIRLSLP